MKYKPRIDLLYTVVILLVPVVAIWGLIVEPVFIAWAFSVFAFLFPIWLWKSTYYEISDGYLIARTMILRTKLKISEIISVIETDNIWSSYALSIKRLEVKTKLDVIYISPLDKEGFVKELKSYNHNIQML